jgi:diguanylate cyclase (GGDEF)-like protein/PAS domain S-box-containing protein
MIRAGQDWLGALRWDRARANSPDENRQLELCQIMWLLRHGAAVVALALALRHGGLSSSEQLVVPLVVLQPLLHLFTRRRPENGFVVIVADAMVLVPLAFMGLHPAVVFTIGVANLGWAATLRPLSAVAAYLVVFAAVIGAVVNDDHVAHHFATWAYLLLGAVFMGRVIRLNMSARRTSERDRLVADGIDAVLWEELPGERNAVKVSAAAERLLGYPAEQWREQGFWPTIVHPDDIAEVVRSIQDTDHTPKPFRARRADGEWIWLENRTSWVGDRNGNPLYRVGVLLDRTAQVESARDAQMFGQLVSSSPVAQLLLRCPDEECHPVIEALNDRCAELLGLDASARGTLLESHRDTSRGVETLVGFLRSEHERTTGTAETEYVDDDGAIYQATLRRVDDRAWTIDFLDVTERVKTGRRLHAQARQDDLTGLPNRRAFIEALDERIACPQGGDTAVLIIDLDEFKEINDSLGHDTGDHLLQSVGRRIAARAKGNDLVARLGGDEFAIIFYDAIPALAEARARELVDAINQPVAVGDLRLRVRASVGVATCPGSAETAEELVRCADVAMYHAKKRSSSVEVYRPDIDNFGSDRVELVAELEQAIASDQLLLLHQPLVDLQSGGGIIGTEVLARWEHPTRGIIGPDVFIELAEVSGQMKNLTRWVLRRALSDLREMREAGHDVEISVNLSVHNLYEPDLVDWLREKIAVAGVPADKLIVEITEHTIMDDQVTAVEMIHNLRDLGVRTWIDDFGTGHSSFARLRSLPVDGLKIDRTFVAAGQASSLDRSILGSIIELARSLGLRSIGEGVEDQASLALLAELGCDLAQGYHLGRPMPLDATMTLLVGGPKAAEAESI